MVRRKRQGLKLRFKPEELCMHQKDGYMHKNLPPSWGCKTITDLFALQCKGFIWYVLHTVHLSAPRSMRLVPAGKLDSFPSYRMGK